MGNGSDPSPTQNCLTNQQSTISSTKQIFAYASNLESPSPPSTKNPTSYTHGPCTTFTKQELKTTKKTILRRYTNSADCGPCEGEISSTFSKRVRKTTFAIGNVPRARLAPQIALQFKETVKKTNDC